MSRIQYCRVKHNYEYDSDLDYLMVIMTFPCNHIRERERELALLDQLFVCVHNGYCLEMLCMEPPSAQIHLLEVGSHYVSTNTVIVWRCSGRNLQAHNTLAGGWVPLCVHWEVQTQSEWLSLLLQNKYIYTIYV